MDKKVEIQDQQTVFQKRKFRVEEGTLRFEKWSGQMSETVQRMVFERGDAAGALIFNTDTRKIILIEQFRYATYEKGPGWLTEVVAGMIDGDETPEDCIRREIHEEIGYDVQTLMPIAHFYPSPGACSERIFLYYAEVQTDNRSTEGGGLAAEHEDIQLVELTLPELWQRLDAGQITDAKTLIAAQWLRAKI